MTPYLHEASLLLCRPPAIEAGALSCSRSLGGRDVYEWKYKSAEKTSDDNATVCSDLLIVTTVVVKAVHVANACSEYSSAEKVLHSISTTSTALKRFLNAEAVGRSEQGPKEQKQGNT